MRLCIYVGSTIRVTAHWAREKVLLLNLMLHILLLFSGYWALIRRCALNVVWIICDTLSMDWLRRDTSTWLLANLGLHYSWRIVLLLWDISLRATSIVTLLRRWGNLEALYEFLVVLSCCALSIPYTFYCMLLILWDEKPLTRILRRSLIFLGDICGEFPICWAFAFPS